MFTSLLRWEFRALTRDPSSWLVTTLAALAIGLALYNGTGWLGRLRALGDSAARVEAETVAGARAKAAQLDAAPDGSVIPTYDPRNAYGYAYFQMQHSIVLPATPLAALVTGQSDLLAQALPLNPGTPPALLGTAEPDNPYRLLTGPFDAAFVVVSLVPLLVIALTYGLLAGERERGTLPLSLAQPVSLRAHVMARLVPRVLLVLGLLTLGAAVFTAGVRFAPGAAGPRLGLWLAVALAYAACWFALSLAVVTRRGNSAAHALILAALWLGLVVLVPAGINLAVKALHPVPSRVELILALRDATDEISAHASKLLAGYYEDHPEFAPKPAADTEYSSIRFITNEQLDRQLAPVLARYEAQLARQQALAGKLQFLSPALLAHGAMADAAGTGVERHREFMRQAAAHHAALRAFFNPRILRKEPFTAWAEVPAFTFAEEPPRRIARGVLPALLGLGLFAAGSATLAGRALRRYPVTG